MSLLSKYQTGMWYTVPGMGTVIPGPEMRRLIAEDMVSPEVSPEQRNVAMQLWYAYVLILSVYPSVEQWGVGRDDSGEFSIRASWEEPDGGTDVPRNKRRPKGKLVPGTQVDIRIYDHPKSGQKKEEDID